MTLTPFPFEYIGRDAATRFYTVALPRRGRRLVPTRANGQPALTVYTSDDSGDVFRATSLLVIALTGEQVAEIIRFDPWVLQHFGMPQILAS